MKFINLTPHQINIFNSEGDVELLSLKSDGVARCATKSNQVGTESGIPIHNIEYGDVTGLPEQEAGVGLVVSFLVRQAEATRGDLYSPGELIRNVETGQPKGCKGLQK